MAVLSAQGVTTVNCLEWKSMLKCCYDQVIDIHFFLHFRIQYDVLTYLAKFQFITKIRSHSFFYFYFREFTAAIT